VSLSSSLPEVVGNAGIYFNPENVNDIAEKMIGLLKDEELKKRLRKEGRFNLKNLVGKKQPIKPWRCLRKFILRRKNI